MPQRFRNLGQQFDGMVLDRIGKTLNLRVRLRRNRMHTQALERAYKRVGEAVQAIAVRHDAFPLDIVEHFTDLLRREFVMVQKRDELGDGPLEVDIVLPERVVGVDEEGLGGQASSSWPLALGS